MLIPRLALLCCVLSFFASAALCEDEDSALIGGRREKQVLPDGAIAQNAPSEEYLKMALSPDGRFAAIACSNGKVHIFSTIAAVLKKTLEIPGGECNDVDFSIDGKSVFTAGADKIVREFEIETGNELRKFEGHESEVHAVAASPDGARLASSDGSGTIRVWSLRDGKQIHAMTGHVLPEGVAGLDPTITIEGLAYSPDSRLIVTEANDVTARVWDTISGKLLRTIPDLDGSTATVAISPDGTLCASTRDGGVARLFEVGSGKIVRVINGHKNNLTGVSFSQDGLYLITSSLDLTVRQWIVESGLELRRFILKSAPTGVACCADNVRAVSMSPDDGVTIWNLQSLPGPVVQWNIESLNEAWKMLGSGEYLERTAAVRKFAGSGAGGVADLLKRLDPKAVDASRKKDVQELIQKLDDSSYGVRLNAYERLKELGPNARHELSDALKNAAGEQRVRVSELLAAIGGQNDGRMVLALEILACLDKPEAAAALKQLSEMKDASYAGYAKTLVERKKK